MMATQFATTLRRLRRERMISQTQLANRASFDHSYLSRLEAGNREPSRDTVSRLGDAMQLADIERSMLFASAGFTTSGDPLRFTSDPELMALAEILWDERLDVGHREQIRHCLRSIAELCSTPKPAMALVA